MGNLDIVDAEEVVDESLQMPEDNLAISSPAPIGFHGAKRKIDEVADSEDEEEDLLARSQPEAKITNARGGEFTGGRSTTNNTQDDDEMLLT